MTKVADMDSFLSKFSLQTFLRQFFCGVVFFCPFLLYTPKYANAFLGGEEVSIKISQDCFSFCTQYGPWDTGKIVFIGIIACIIGTIIYHVEKNLYSYLMQALFEVANVKTNNGKISGKVAFYFFIVALILFVTFLWANAIMLFILALLVFIFWGTSLSNGFSRVVSRTQQSWIIENNKAIESKIVESKIVEGKTIEYKKIEETKKEEELDSLKMAKTISEKVSTWSDFIHCVQSCCFAWLAGSCFVEYFIHADADITLGNSIAVALLLLELIFDWHRYQHVIAMTDGSFSQPDFTHTK